MKFIFRVQIRTEHTEQEYVDAWRKGSAAIQKSAGAKGTVLYRNLDEPGTLIAIAEWESKEARDIAMKKLHSESAEIQNTLDRHKEFGDIEVIGNFEEVARIEPPAAR
ncbi:MAG: antibiotic biosynthesis monooxygenase [Parcubacteria group bacterium]|nr:antibiotic biosynthesis monooxygenase [Parcubacteria group bacterium]